MDAIGPLLGRIKSFKDQNLINEYIQRLNKSLLIAGAFPRCNGLLFRHETAETLMNIRELEAESESSNMLFK
jgi:hypothetical protein